MGAQDMVRYRAMGRGTCEKSGFSAETAWIFDGMYVKNSEKAKKLKKVSKKSCHTIFETCSVFCLHFV